MLIDHAADFTGALLVSFAISEFAIGEHHYGLYALIALAGVAALLLAETTRRKTLP